MRGLGAPGGVIADWGSAAERAVAKAGGSDGVCATGPLESTGRRPTGDPGGADNAGALGAVFDTRTMAGSWGTRRPPDRWGWGWGCVTTTTPGGVRVAGAGTYTGRGGADAIGT